VQKLLQVSLAHSNSVNHPQETELAEQEGVVDLYVYARWMVSARLSTVLRCGWAEIRTGRYSNRSIMFRVADWSREAVLFSNRSASLRNVSTSADDNMTT
jgi:hypothetical protein